MSSDDGLGFEEGIDDLSDEFGDFGDDLDGGFDDDDDFGGFDDGNNEELAELEDRVGELENEVSAISSGMNTVREENKQIGGTVEELDDTIRKLLDIYEMVTRGINPFVDDAREMGGLDGGGSFGLFDAEAEEEEHLDPEVANADAESFFDDDFGELDAEAGEKEAELAAKDELEDAEREDPAAALEKDEENEEDADDTDSVGGSSFDDLKQQYEENDGWDEEEEEEEEEADLLEEEPEVEVEEELDADEEEEPLLEIEDQVEEELPGDETADPQKTLEELEAEYKSAAQAKRDAQAEETSELPQESSSQAKKVVQTTSSNAYLTQLPASYVSEVLILEWVEHLVSAGGALGASRALRQYREQEWISRPVENTLNTHVACVSTSVEGGDGLQIEDHQTSLVYVSRLAGDAPQGHLFEELVAYGGILDGIRS
ncbi:flagella accessory protein C [Haloferax sp. DFSO60]|uniref:flagella accessory protein C n=1 Tax=Haloferax sp. DFSO60 TaxID=3388652 RepID=UPI00397B9EA2